MPAKKTLTIRPNGEIDGGGHVRMSRLGQIEWVCEEDFMLSFQQLLGEGGDWPFKDPQRPFKPTRRFTGTLKDVGPDQVPPVYEYTVSVGAHRSDPIIIVDK